MTAPSRLLVLLRGNPLIGDALLALALVPLVLFAHDPDRPSPASMPAAAAVVAVLTCAVLAVRRSWPRVVLALTVAGSVLVLSSVEGSLIFSTCVVALYTVATRSDRSAAAWAWGLTALPLTAAALSPQAPDESAFTYLPWTVVAAVLGHAVRTRRAYVTAVEERAERAERTREEEALRRVAEERLRIARELHDVVAHRIAVVNVQAGVAAHLLRTEPDAAEEAIAHVRQAGRAVLDEMSDILNVLRQPGELACPTSPAPELALLDSLVESFTSAGLVGGWSVTGRPRPLAATVNLVAYRVLQEALTNAHKHGSGTAQVALAYTPSSVGLVVTNPLPHYANGNSEGGASEAGFGLIGMHERAAAVGGVLEAAPGPDGQFRVKASLPDQEAVAG